MSVALWTSPPFLAEATAWVSEVAERHGLALTGEREQPHARPWSSTVRFESDGGRLWFKVNGPGTRHEAPLLAELGRLVPDLVPEVLGVDGDRGWCLLRDAGPVLRTLAAPDGLWDRWEELLPAYAAAQRVLAGHLPALRRTGLPAAGPDLLPGLLRGLLEDLAGRPVATGGIDAAERRRFETLLPAYDAWCEELAASGLPATVNHDDLHSSNICWGSGGPRVIDWGDACLGHPFGTMLATLNSIGWHARTDPADPRVLRVRDAYLAAYADTGGHDERVRWVDLARRTGCVTRALSYVHAFEGAPADEQAAEDWPVRGWLRELLEPATDP